MTKAQQKLLKDQQTQIDAIIKHLSKIDTLDDNINKIAKLLNIDTKNKLLNFKDEALAKSQEMKKTIATSQQKVEAADTKKELENKKVPESNAWVEHLKKIKEKLFINHKDAMIIAKDPTSVYYYKTDRAKKEKKPKKEKKVHICDFCKKRLYDKSGLNRHMKVHRLEIASLRGQIKKQAKEALPALKERLEKLLDYFRKIDANEAKDDAPQIEEKKVAPKTQEKKIAPKIQEKKVAVKTKGKPFKITQKFISQINNGYKEINDEELGLTSDMIKGTEYINGNVTFNIEGLTIDEIENIDKITIVDDPEKDEIYTIELNQIMDNGDVVVYDEFEVDKD